jgi:serine/threonine protein kinase
MATVYLARDPKHGRLVALKVLRPELAATLGSDRFLREIQVAARLTHPHILPLHDSGEAGGLLYYVMPYIDGESVRDRPAGRFGPGRRHSLPFDFKAVQRNRERLGKDRGRMDDRHGSRRGLDV